MLKKAKIYKTVISIVAFFCFVYWGLDSEMICRLASETPKLCESSISERGFLMDALGSGLAISLCAMAAGILTIWVKKD